MLRKTTHIIIALLLLLVTSGTTISMHYCGGDYVSSAVNGEAEACCDGSGGCCENKTVHFEVEDDFTSPIVVENNTSVELDILFPILFVFIPELLDDTHFTQVAYIDTSPPPKIQTRLSLLQTYLC